MPLGPWAQVTVDRHPATQAVTAHGPGGPGSGSGCVPPAVAPLDLGMLGGLVSLLGDNQGPDNSSSDPSFEVAFRFELNLNIDLSLRLDRSRTGSGGGAAGSQQRARRGGAAVNATAAGLQASGQVLQERSPAIMQARMVHRKIVLQTLLTERYHTCLPGKHGPLSVHCMHAVPLHLATLFFNARRKCPHLLARASMCVLTCKPCKHGRLDISALPCQSICVPSACSTATRNTRMICSELVLRWVQGTAVAGDRARPLRHGVQPNTARRAISGRRRSAADGRHVGKPWPKHFHKPWRTASDGRRQHHLG